MRSAPPVIGDLALNRATLARQHLLERAAMNPYEAIGHLVGLQAQTPKSWYLTLWSRLRDFDPEATGRLLEERRLVRSWFMRQTIHLVTDADAPVLRAFTQPVIERSVRGKWLEALRGIDLGELAEVVRSATTAAPRTPSELTAIVSAHWPQATDHIVITNAAKALVALVQEPPRGVWGRGGAVRLSPLDAWLGTSIPSRVDPLPILRRYLAAYGPASIADAQMWAGVTRLGAAFEQLRPELLVLQGPDGRELFDLPGAPRPDPATPAPVRFLADYDNVLLAHADRSRFGDGEAREKLTYREGPYPSYLLVDGRVAGAWYARVEGSRVTARVDTVRPLHAAEEAAVRAEADAMLRFNYPKATERRVEVAPIS